MDSPGCGGFSFIIQFESRLQEQRLPTDQGPHPFDKVSQLPPQAKAFTLGQDPKQNLVHLLLSFLVGFGPLVALQRICLRQQCDSLLHLLVNQGGRSFLHQLQVVVERKLAHLVLFELLQVHLQNTFEQFLHEPASTLLVISLPCNKLPVALGGLT